jgi:2-C-methyl-D-erythritol 2,4-cyclodiphosphate synthase/2-C-methyl-D-erythritol 4-phosphate cytidylyltransferase
MSKVFGVVLAAGAARRMGRDKMTLQFGGKSVLVRSLEALEASACFDRIILVCREDGMEEAAVAARSTLHTPYSLVAGGSERQFSVENALAAITEDGIVAVHDAARCFVSPADIRACVQKARETGAAALGGKPKDTIKTTENGIITGTVDRERLINIQTPQVFSVSLFKQAHAKAKADGFVGTDDCMLVERLGHPISCIEASGPNLKITTQEDIALAQHLAGAAVRTGFGYDAHRLVTTRPLILGGVEIPHTHGLLGHSDADVLIHAIMDALLGAAALGDIGRHFPGTDEFKDISSLVLLARVHNLIESAGFAIVNVDSTVVMQRPRLAPYIEQMRRRIAEALDIDISAVSVKATTTEGMGFEGTGEGVSATAVATLTG